jgi:hypothetical protein
MAMYRAFILLSIAELEALSDTPLLVRTFQDRCLLQPADAVTADCRPQFAFGLCHAESTPQQQQLVPYYNDTFTKYVCAHVGIYFIVYSHHSTTSSCYFSCDCITFRVLRCDFH